MLEMLVLEHEQSAVINFLSDPSSYAGVQAVDCIETHGNLVFLAGCEAWKIKRAVRFPYMDFSTLEKRRAACAREVEINRRFAPDLYLGCVPITVRTDGKLAFAGTGRPVEWAVHLRRFEQSALLSSFAGLSGITADRARQIADAVYESHCLAERACPPSGTAPIGTLLRALSSSLARSAVFDRDEVAYFSSETERRLQDSAALLQNRARKGFVRRCHGDLHLANIVIWHDQPTLYDAIEFDEGMATIDTLYDLAFLLMDLERYAQHTAANVILSRYLWRSQADLDLEALAALPLFLAMRAAVRAMVTTDRAEQEVGQARTADQERARQYFRSAINYLRPAPPRMVAVAGLSGTGKSTLGAWLAPLVGCSPGAVHLRSDLERKTLAGVGELEHLPASAYTSEARHRIYEVLQHKARSILAAGHSVVVDAVYAAPHERLQIERLGADLGVSFRGVWLTADRETIVSRVAARSNDASDATADVVEAQLRYDTGVLSPCWTRIDAGGSAAETLRLTCAALALVPRP